MSLTRDSVGPPSGPLPDSALSELLPPRRRSRAAVAVVAALVLSLAWFSPQLLRPSIWDGSGGGLATTFAADGPQVLTTTVMDTESWLPFEVVGVEDVRGAHVVDAWLVTGPDVEAAQRGVTGSPPSVEDYLTGLTPVPADANRLPRRVGSGGPASLLVLWAIDDCVRLEETAAPVVTLRNAIGATVTDTLPEFSAPGWYLLPAPEASDAGFDLCSGG